MDTVETLTANTEVAKDYKSLETLIHFCNESGMFSQISDIEGILTLGSDESYRSDTFLRRFTENILLDHEGSFGMYDLKLNELKDANSLVQKIVPGMERIFKFADNILDRSLKVDYIHKIRFVEGLIYYAQNVAYNMDKHIQDNYDNNKRVKHDSDKALNHAIRLSENFKQKIFTPYVYAYNEHMQVLARRVTMMEAL